MAQHRLVPAWGAFGTTVALLVIVLVLIHDGNYPGLAGSVLGYICGYWLPTRPGPPAGGQDG